MRIDATQHMLAWIWRRKQIVAPPRRELTSKVRMIRMRH
jgi:hypothetical protein